MQKADKGATPSDRYNSNGNNQKPVEGITRIFIVDNDPDTREIMEMLLTANGYSTEIVATGEEVLAKVRMYKPDLIILDYFLSGMLGTEICQHLKSIDDIKHIPIIMYSIHPTAAESARSAGAEGFIAKPFSVKDLLKEIKKHLR